MKNARNVFLSIVVAALLMVGLPGIARAHCQLPCGMYNDHARIVSMLEDAGLAVL